MKQLRGSWFAIWRLPRWALALLIISLPIAYLLASPPLFYVLIRVGIADRHPKLISTVLIPGEYLYRNCDTYRGFADWQKKTMESTFGPMR